MKTVSLVKYLSTGEVGVVCSSCAYEEIRISGLVSEAYLLMEAHLEACPVLALVEQGIPIEWARVHHDSQRGNSDA